MKARPTFTTRFITEDIAFGLVTWADLGDLAGVETPLMDAVVHIAASIHCVNYSNTGRTLKNLGLGHLTKNQLIEYVTSGSLRTARSGKPIPTKGGSHEKTRLSLNGCNPWIRDVTCPGLAMAQTAIKVGNILPLSGPSASVGLQNKQAQDMAIEEINAAGGIKSMGGAKIECWYADSESKPEKGVAEAERFINTEKVAVLTGCWNSAVSYPYSAVAERAGMPFIVPVSVADKITEQGFKYTFRIAAKDGWYVRDQFAFMAEIQKEFNVKLSTLAFVYENGDWGKGMASSWKKLAEQGGYKVVLDEPYPSTATDLSPVPRRSSAPIPMC